MPEDESRINISANQMAPGRHGDFANVDAAPDPAHFVHYLTRDDDEPLTERQRLSYALLHAREGMRNGWIGRRLPDLFRQCGLTDLHSVPTTTHSTHLSAYPRNLVTLAQQREVLTAEEAQATLAEWDTREANGAYLEFGLFFTVAGRKC